MQVMATEDKRKFIQLWQQKEKLPNENDALQQYVIGLLEYRKDHYSSWIIHKVGIFHFQFKIIYV
jgi:hypothetical protein